MSQLLNTGLDADTLALCVRLCENGINPEALALVIQELRRESAAVKVPLSYFYDICHIKSDDFKKSSFFRFKFNCKLQTFLTKAF